MHSTWPQGAISYKTTQIPHSIPLLSKQLLSSSSSNMIYLVVVFFFFRLISAVGPTVDLSYLKIQGIDPGNGVSQWFGIPYATAPLGQYRWKAPVDYPKSTQLYQANAVSPTNPCSPVRRSLIGIIISTSPYASPTQPHTL